MKLKNKYNCYDTMPINELKNMIENTNDDILSINEILNTHLQDYKNNCKLNYNETKKINERIDSMFDYIEVVNLNNKLLKAATEYYYLKSEINFLLLNNEFSKIESLPWYKRIFKRFRNKAIAEAITEVMKNHKPELDKAKNNFDKSIKELDLKIKEKQ